jgi:hypothetical protein
MDVQLKIIFTIVIVLTIIRMLDYMLVSIKLKYMLRFISGIFILLSIIVNLIWVIARLWS